MGGPVTVRAADVPARLVSEEPECLVCGGDGQVDEPDDWQDYEFDGTCPSCAGSGLAKDMRFC